MSDKNTFNIDPFVVESVNKLHQLYPTVHHTLITNIATLAYDVEEIHYIAKNMYYVVKNFPRFLSAITANMDDYLIRMPLIENLFEEHGRMNLEHVHLRSYIHFLEQIGISSQDLETFEPCAGVIAYTRSVLDLCLHYNYLEGLAALGIIEDIVHQVSPIIGQTTKKNIADVERVSHFTEHEVLDEQHSQEIYALLTYNNEQERKLIERGLAFGAYYHSKLYSDIADQVVKQYRITTQDTNVLLTEFSEEKLNQSNNAYPLAQGKAAVKRLEVLNHLYNKKSIAAIKEYIHPPTTSILEVGCGIGILAHQLSKEIDPSIKVLATDSSEAQIEVASRMNPTSKNLRFAVCDCKTLGDLKEEFDLIYMRWVMIYQKNIPNIIKQCYQVLKPGGYLIIEDNNPVESGCYSYEQTHTIKKWDQFFKSAFIKAGQTANLEKLIIDTYQELSMQEIRKTINQCTLIEKEEKEVFYLGIEESKPSIIEAGIKQEYINSFIEELKTISESKYPVDFVKNFQLIARKQQK
jgi:pyrroloquinoline-quinone synthase